MAAPPPPPPPPPAPGPIGKPNTSKLLESIRQGTGLKKVPESEKKDRSTAIVGTKPSGNTSAVPLPPGMKAPSGSQMSLLDALKARTPTGCSAAPLIPPPKRSDIPAPNQNVGPNNNIPKPPDANSKPTNANAFPPPPSPMLPNATPKPFAPPPVFQNKPPPIANTNRPFAPPPPPKSFSCEDKPLAPPPPMQSSVTNKPMAPPPPINMSNIPPPPPPPVTDFKPSLPPPIFYSMKPTSANVAQPPRVYPSINRSVPNSGNIMNGSARSTPPLAAPPPPPPISSMPSNVLPKKPIPNRPEVPCNPSPAVKNESKSFFDSKFTFLEESSFPLPSSVSKRTKEVV